MGIKSKHIRAELLKILEVFYISQVKKKQCFNEQRRSLKYESVNDDARIEGDRLSTKLGN